MAFIEEAIISGLISKIINDGIDVSISAIKAARGNKSDKKRDISLQIYDVIISALNTVTHNKYAKNQELIYKSTEYLLNNLRSYDTNHNREIFKQCCCNLRYSYSNELYAEFIKQIHIELSKEKNIELYRQVLLKILNEKNAYDQEVTKVLIDKLNQILQLLNGNRDNNDIDTQTEIQQKEINNIVEDNAEGLAVKNVPIEKIVLANYFRGLEAVGGRIYFDNVGLTFKSHKFNIQRGETRIEYSQIVSVSKRSTLGMVPNGISIFTKDGKEHKFVVYNRQKIIDFLKNKAAL